MQDTSDDASARDDTVPAGGRGRDPFGAIETGSKFYDNRGSLYTDRLTAAPDRRNRRLRGRSGVAGEALSGALPARTGAAFLNVQHLSSHFKSLVEELLAHPGTDQARVSGPSTC